MMSARILRSERRKHTHSRRNGYCTNETLVECRCFCANCLRPHDWWVFVSASFAVDLSKNKKYTEDSGDF